MTIEKTMFAAGCFWGVESAFSKVPGVMATTAGCTGGNTIEPTYKEVCTGITGHAEAVLVEFDPRIVSYGGLLDIFWEIHDPTTLNRQGPDDGTQYRSAIFFLTLGQEAAARRSKERLDASGHYRDPVVTEIVPADEFYRTEEYHQRYNEKHGRLNCV